MIRYAKDSEPIGHYEMRHETEISWEIWSEYELHMNQGLMAKGPEFTNLRKIEVHSTLMDNRYNVCVSRRHTRRVFVPHQYFGG